MYSSKQNVVNSVETGIGEKNIANADGSFLLIYCVSKCRVRYFAGRSTLPLLLISSESKRLELKTDISSARGRQS